MSCRVSQFTLTDIDLSLHDDEGARGDFAGGDDAFARRVSPAFTEPRQSLNICRLQDRERLIVSGFDQRGTDCGIILPYGLENPGPNPGLAQEP